MNTGLLISIGVMVLITLIASITTLVIVTKYTKQEKIVGKVLKIVGIVIAALAVLSLAIGISFVKKDDSKSPKDYNEVTLNEYLNIINSDEKSVILVARPTCTYCQKFSPILKQAAGDLDLVVNYIDTDKFSEDDWKTFNNSLSYYTKNEWGTPLTLIVQKGEIVDVNSGYTDLATIKNFFTKNGLGK